MCLNVFLETSNKAFPLSATVSPPAATDKVQRYVVRWFGFIARLVIPVVFYHILMVGPGTNLFYDFIHNVSAVDPFYVLVRIPVRTGLFHIGAFLSIRRIVFSMAPRGKP